MSDRHRLVSDAISVAFRDCDNSTVAGVRAACARIVSALADTIAVPLPDVPDDVDPAEARRLAGEWTRNLEATLGTAQAASDEDEEE